METSEALKIIKALADGINPFTGEVIPDDSPYQNPQMVRALFKAVSALESREKSEQRRRYLPKNAGNPWYDEEESKLISEFDSGLSISDIAKKHKRTKGSIRSRLEKLGKIKPIERK